MAGITPLTPALFNDFTRLNKYVVIHFWAAWNRYDDEQKRLIESNIPEDLVARIAFGSFEVDPPEHHAICMGLNIRNLPFFALYRQGVLFNTRTGALNQENIIQLLRELIADEL